MVLRLDRGAEIEGRLAGTDSVWHVIQARRQRGRLKGERKESGCLDKIEERDIEGRLARWRSGILKAGWLAQNLYGR